MSCHNEHPVAFVLSSGANLGAVQVGMLRALIEHGIYPDIVVGCSVGALNGAGLAQDPTPAGVARIDEQLRVPFQCVATDVVQGTAAWFHSGPLVDAVLASAAMPAMFPSVEIDGRRFLDGAIVNDVPVDRAAALGARTLYVLEVGPLTRTWSEPKRPLDTVMQAYWIARRHRFRSALAALPTDVTVHRLPHGEPRQLRLHDFGHSGELMAAAYAASSAYLDQLQATAPADAATAGAPAT